jgi:hypothetical protein
MHNGHQEARFRPPVLIATRDGQFDTYYNAVDVYLADFDAVGGVLHGWEDTLGAFQAASPTLTITSVDTTLIEPVEGRPVA